MLAFITDTHIRLKSLHKNSGHHCNFVWAIVMLAFTRHTHQVKITAQKTVDIIVWAIVMLAFTRHTHQVKITAQKTVDIIVWVIVMLAFTRYTHQVKISGHHCNFVWAVVMLAFTRHTHQVEIIAQKISGHHWKYLWYFDILNCLLWTGYNIPEIKPRILFAWDLVYLAMSWLKVNVEWVLLWPKEHSLRDI